MNSDITMFYNVCTLASDTFGLPILVISSSGDIIFEYAYDSKNTDSIYHKSKENLIKSLGFDPHIAYDYPVIVDTPNLESFIIISIKNCSFFKGSILFGPSLPSTFLKSALLRISRTLFYMFNKEIISDTDVITKPFVISTESETKKAFDSAISKKLEMGTFNSDLLFEKNLFSAVNEGRLDTLKTITRFSSTNNNHVILSKSSLIRSAQNQFICLITLMTRAAIEGGLNPEIAFTLSDTYIQRNEELNTINDINLLSYEAMVTYTEKVSQVKEEQHSKIITACKRFIYNQIYNEFSHKDIAKAVSLSPSYLTTLFKKEVGISVQEYIQKTKIKEAQRLLANSNTPISQICALLNFTDQSYFTKVFKKHVGMTPRQYKEQNHSL